MESSRRARRRSSTLGLTTVAGIITLSALGAAPAQAQYGYEPDLLMPPRAVVWRLNNRGFTEVTRPRFDGRAYVVEATGPYGDRVRLFVDGRDGAVLGRQRLDAPLQPPPVRVARPAAPGYGWTEDDAQSARPAREAERLVPPGAIQNGDGVARQPRFDVAARPDPSPRGDPADRNPLGLNPDGRTGEARRPPETAQPRRAARATPPAKPATPRLTPEAPRPAVTTAPQQAPAKTEPPVAAIESPKPLPPTSQPSTPAANQPRREDAQSPAPGQAPPGKAQAWSDPPAEKKAVRVIGGATVVPGASESASPDRPAE